MNSKVKVVHYINQFFAGIGGEEQADTPLEVRTGPVGPGMGLEKSSAGKLEVLRTIVCGDNFFHSHADKVMHDVVNLIREASPDVVVAGPAFNAGRYGIACRAICEQVQKEIGVPTVTAMHKENPGISTVPIETYILPCGDSARDMGSILPALADFSYRLGTGAKIEDAEREGYYPRGIRRNVIEEQVGAVRAIAMLRDKLAGRKYKTEIPLPTFDKIAPPAPITDLSKATIALVTDGGVVPKGNPDRLESARASKWFKYIISGTKSLDKASYECIHGGFDLAAANEDPNRIVPLDALWELEIEGNFGKLYDYFYSTTGNCTPVVNCTRFGKEIAGEICSVGVDAVILTAT